MQLLSRQSLRLLVDHVGHCVISINGFLRPSAINRRPDALLLFLRQPPADVVRVSGILVPFARFIADSLEREFGEYLQLVLRQPITTRRYAGMPNWPAVFIFNSLVSRVDRDCN